MTNAGRRRSIVQLPAGGSIQAVQASTPARGPARRRATMRADMTTRDAGPPEAQGLYDPRQEHDSCGVGFVVDIKGRRSHDIVRKALQVLINLLHRGACGCEPNTGDGAGILLQMPDRFFRKVTAGLGVSLPPLGEYGAGLVFLPRGQGARDKVEALIATIVD